MKKKNKKIIITVPILIVLIIGVVLNYLVSNKVNYLNLREAHIGGGGDEAPSLTLNFDSGEASLYYSKTQKEKNINVDKEELKKYKKYFIKYWNEKKDIKYNNLPDPTPKGYDPINIYWTIRAEKRNNLYKYMQGLSYYPKGWKEFIAETNKLLGDEYLSDDTEGLELK